MQDIQRLLQEAEEALKEFLNSSCRSERALNFLKGKIFVYRRVLNILKEEKEVKSK